MHGLVQYHEPRVTSFTRRSMPNHRISAVGPPDVRGGVLIQVAIDAFKRPGTPPLILDLVRRHSEKRALRLPRTPRRRSGISSASSPRVSPRGSPPPSRGCFGYDAWAGTSRPGSSRSTAPHACSSAAAGQASTGRNGKSTGCPRPGTLVPSPSTMDVRLGCGSTGRTPRLARPMATIWCEFPTRVAQGPGHRYGAVRRRGPGEDTALRAHGRGGLFR